MIIEPVVMECPECHKLHVDEGEFAKRPHHTHRCVDDAAGTGCGHEWRLEHYVRGVERDATAWHQRFMDMALLVSHWSKDPSTKAGAVVVDEQRRVLSLGYNGFPRGVVDHPDRYANRAVKYKLVVHAEANAILTAYVGGATLYATKWPCSDCSKLIAQAGIARVVARRQGANASDVDPHWADDHRWAELILREAGVKVVEL